MKRIFISFFLEFIVLLKVSEGQSNPCEKVECSINGFCRRINDYSSECICKMGFTGLNCNVNADLKSGLEYLSLANQVADKVGELDDHLGSFARIAKNFGVIGGIVSLAFEIFIPKEDPLDGVYKEFDKVNDRLKSIEQKIEQISFNVNQGFSDLSDKIDKVSMLKESRDRIFGIRTNHFLKIEEFLMKFKTEFGLKTDYHRNIYLRNCAESDAKKFLDHMDTLLRITKASIKFENLKMGVSLFYHVLRMSDFTDVYTMLQWQDTIFKLAIQLSVQSKLCDGALRIDSLSQQINFQVLSSKLNEITDAMKNQVNELDSINNAHFIGCFKDVWNQRDLNRIPWTLTPTMTHRKCIDYCTYLGYKYAGLQDGHLCFCGSDDFRKHGIASLSECDKQCKGSAQSNLALCGGFDRNAVYQTRLSDTTNAEFKGYFRKPPAHFYEFNLIRENNQIKIGRIDECVRHCENLYFSHALLSEGDTCSCDNIDDVIMSGLEYRDTFDTNEKSTLDLRNCRDNNLIYCGGASHYSIYKTNSPIRERVENAPYVGCFRDLVDRDLYGKSFFQISDLSISKCIKLCKINNFKFAGVQSGDQCFCGNQAGKYYFSDKCHSMDQWTICSGNRNEICGSSWTNSVYSLRDGGGDPRGIRVGCFRDRDQRDFSEVKHDDFRNDYASCFKHCSEKGYTYAALQYGRECWCGNYYGRYGTADNCNMPCTGNRGQTCGGLYANEVFSIVPKLYQKREKKYVIVGGGSRDYWMQCTLDKNCISTRDKSKATRFEKRDLYYDTYKYYGYYYYSEDGANTIRARTWMFQLFGTNYCLTTWNWRMILKECEFDFKDQQWYRDGLNHFNSGTHVKVWYKGDNNELENVKACLAWQCIWDFEEV
ncbi:unnamed protein product [Brachionus calyciflorus]|uniref:WSC domain-containing protein n=1 Tax=Brachionus calyciflorus TaxID=104777 RepID=A0A813NX49_9BILA|nr:unnamed protein product [Brachionus calyciflorus]